jgi:hypothetical protein
MAKYRKKPVVVEAEQFWPGSSLPPGVIAARRSCEQDWKYQIETLEGPLAVKPGDWIITSIKGERYPCKPDIFEATYERVADGEEDS